MEKLSFTPEQRAAANNFGHEFKTTTQGVEVQGMAFGSYWNVVRFLQSVQRLVLECSTAAMNEQINPKEFATDLIPLLELSEQLTDKLLTPAEILDKLHGLD